jgi:hypothetical protein
MTSIRGSLSRHSDELLGKPWKAFAFIDASAPDTPKQLYVKVLFTPRSYAIMATDLTLLWMEDLPEDELEFKFDSEMRCIQLEYSWQSLTELALGRFRAFEPLKPVIFRALATMRDAK